VTFQEKTMKPSVQKLFTTPLTLSMMTLAILASTGAAAQDTGWYAGANVGSTRASIDDERITSGLLGSGLAVTSIQNDDRSRGYKLFGGYQFNKNLGLEGGYFDLGEFGYRANTVPAGSLTGNIKLRGLNLDLVGTVPITEKFSAFGRLGVTRIESRDTFVGTGAVRVLNPNPSTRDNNLKVGLGVQYAFTPALSMRAELERYRVNDAIGNKGDVDMVSVGLVYRFGAKAPTPVAQPYQPEPVALAPMPAPVVVPPAPAPVYPAPTPRVPTKVTLSADSLFDFDQSIVKPGGRAELDQLATGLKGLEYDVINVTGHTDRLGPQAYNLKLSTRRAEAVSAYLVASAGIPAQKINARGVNGADPVTRPGECKGAKPTPALIACLQPDRRVEIEVTGQR
jgi:OOP family OmpA-OmpF porin